MGHECHLFCTSRPTRINLASTSTFLTKQSKGRRILTDQVYRGITYVDRHFRNYVGDFQRRICRPMRFRMALGKKFGATVAARQNQLIKATETVGYSCALRSICDEVIYAITCHTHYVDSPETTMMQKSMSRRFYPTGRNRPLRNMGIGTTGRHFTGEPLYAGALSSGTQSTLLWIWALALQNGVRHYELGGGMGRKSQPYC